MGESQAGVDERKKKDEKSKLRGRDAARGERKGPEGEGR
jgi:hypothetical protein